MNACCQNLKWHHSAWHTEHSVLYTVWCSLVTNTNYEMRHTHHWHDTVDCSEAAMGNEVVTLASLTYFRQLLLGTDPLIQWWQRRSLLGKWPPKFQLWPVFGQWPFQVACSISKILSTLERGVNCTQNPWNTSHHTQITRVCCGNILWVWWHKLYICNLLPFPTLTEFWKLVRFTQSYRHQLVVHYLGHSVVLGLQQKDECKSCNNK